MTETLRQAQGERYGVYVLIAPLRTVMIYTPLLGQRRGRQRGMDQPQALLGRG